MKPLSSFRVLCYFLAACFLFGIGILFITFPGNIDHMGRITTAGLLTGSLIFVLLFIQELARNLLAEMKKLKS